VHRKYVDLLKGASTRVCVNSLSLLCSEQHVAAAQCIKKIVRIELLSPTLKLVARVPGCFTYLCSVSLLPISLYCPSLYWHR